jgi:hypothetical protein
VKVQAPNARLITVIDIFFTLIILFTPNKIMLVSTGQTINRPAFEHLY